MAKTLLNGKRLATVSGFEYDNFIPTVRAVSIWCTTDGNIWVVDKEHRLFNVHPAVVSRWNKATQKNEEIVISYPVRYQVCSMYDVPQELQQYFI